jgi:hypothetical protein
MQFLSDGRYIASVVDGKLQFYGVAIVLDQPLNRRAPPVEAVCSRNHCRVRMSRSTIVVETIPLEASSI